MCVCVCVLSRTSEIGCVVCSVAVIITASHPPPVHWNIIGYSHQRTRATPPHMHMRNDRKTFVVVVATATHKRADCHSSSLLLRGPACVPQPHRHVGCVRSKPTHSSRPLKTNRLRTLNSGRLQQHHVHRLCV